jgi:putative hemolysin
MYSEQNSTRPRFVTSLAATRADVRAAQRLRYRVFAEEMGARMPHAALGLDHDRFDPWCDHLLVRDGRGGPVVGTYRILPADVAARLGGFFSEQEFELGAVRGLPGLVEVGRACVDPEHRGGPVLALLWGGLVGYLGARRSEHVMGCASVFVGDDPSVAGAVCRRLLRDHMGPPAWRVAPRTPFVVPGVEPAEKAAVPPLIRSYLRLGACVCGDPAWDPDFRTADVLLVLSMARMHARYARRIPRAA